MTPGVGPEGQSAVPGTRGQNCATEVETTLKVERCALCIESCSL
jgi:hypothetical protein